MNIQRLMVVGGGQMGSGIVQVAADAGINVILYDIDPVFSQKGLTTIRNNLVREVEKSRKSQAEIDSILARISLSSDLEDGQNADLVIEAIVENLQIKSELFKKLDKICPQHAILASNTSSLGITEIASFTKRPEQVIGMHYMNPVPVMKLVEVIRGLRTSDETYLRVENLAKRMDKVPIEVNDFPGFVSNRILLSMINEAVYCVYEGVATKEAIDEVTRLGMNHPMGPLALADFIGLDTCLAIMEVLHEGFGDSKYRPCPLLRKYVAAGWLGKKSGRGFYEYE
ncbi:3-hydroxybutyryl-CoA dehydrogenase [Cohnella silvisoli]|uniref:3-hydroxybutyryl-CoA dehydrogenase n=1 Tax=Cohnella silvisoli TaxID=2873699 RepID=A0ABV1KWT1_9BACL|nr:3-hydroxybutyryl-CoA dehydrogenase [Cohnella silvisoli]MCD9023837.1 3-hydroxybutyryl-CoA dehydrogenase [Cohnella silvisoli]